MKFFPVWAGLLALSILWSGCSLSSRVQNRDRYVQRVQLRKGPCFGQCPVYKLTVYDNGLLVYEGERYTEKTGTHAKMIDRTALNELMREFYEAKLFNYQDVYQSEIPDLQTVELTYTTREGQTKRIIGKENRPEVVTRLERRLDVLANSPGWQEIAPPDDRDPATSQQRPNEILVELKAGVDPNAWLVRYLKQNVQLKERVAPNRNVWVFSFDNQIISGEQLLQFVRRDTDVQSAQLNGRPVEYRQ